MNILTLDCETTTFRKGNPFSKRNKLCYVGVKFYDFPSTCIYNLLTEDIYTIRYKTQKQIDIADIIVGFNIKFDIHWLMNIGVTFNNVRQIWDCQLAEFLLESQQNPYNSLNDALTKYGKPCKLDVVKTEFWDKGIDTPDIPEDIMREYLEYDCEGTERVFIEQAKQFGIKL